MTDSPAKTAKATAQAPKKTPKPRGGRREGAGRRRQWVHTKIKHEDYWVLATMAAVHNSTLEEESERWLRDAAEQYRSQAAQHRSQAHFAQDEGMRRLSKRIGLHRRKPLTTG